MKIKTSLIFVAMLFANSSYATAQELLLVGVDGQGQPSQILALNPINGTIQGGIIANYGISNIATDVENVYSRSLFLERYNVPTSSHLTIASSDAFTTSRGMAISPDGVFFASNGFNSGHNTDLIKYLDTSDSSGVRLGSGQVQYIYPEVYDPSKSIC